MTAFELSLLGAGVLLVCVVWIIWLVITVGRLSRMCDDLATRTTELSADVSMLRLGYEARHGTVRDRRACRE